MSVLNNRPSINSVKAKAISFTCTVALLLFFSVVNTVNVHATVPVPSGFTAISSGTGVTVYRKNYTGGQPDFVTVVDLRYATLQSYTGWAQSDGTVERRSLTTHWQNAVAQNTSTRIAKVAINGTFFDPNMSPYTGIAFGLKANWWIMSRGYAAGTEYPGLIRTLTYDATYNSSSIQAYNSTTFDQGISDVVGGLDPTANKDRYSNIPRTFVGVRDDNGDGHCETVIFFSSKYATQAWATNILTGFGTVARMMLDGGGSTGLVVDGTQHIPTSRTLPHVFIVSAGK
ncbi:MAG TPA: phosphodiester glycosidase family protein [Pyrinomonadaceae bacterium]|jgi:hypothetical protein